MAHEHEASLDELLQRSAGRLATAEVFDLDAFKKLYSYACNRAAELQHDPVLPKQLLACLLQASQILESRAEYLPEVRAHIDLSPKFRQLLFALISSETADSRRAGVPRIL